MRVYMRMQYTSTTSSFFALLERWLGPKAEPVLTLHLKTCVYFFCFITKQSTVVHSLLYYPHLAGYGLTQRHYLGPHLQGCHDLTTFCCFLQMKIFIVRRRLIFYNRSHPRRLETFECFFERNRTTEKET